MESSRDKRRALLRGTVESCAVQLRAPPPQTRIVALPSPATLWTPHPLVTSRPFLPSDARSRHRGAGFGPPSFYLLTSLRREGRGAGALVVPRRSREARPLRGRVSVAPWTFWEGRREKLRSRHFYCTVSLQSRGCIISVVDLLLYPTDELNLITGSYV